jgi:predicted AAA+ superfamily ATPase
LDQDLFFYRDNAGREVDLIIHDRGARLVRLIEIKSGHTAKHEWIVRLEEIAAILGPYLNAEGAKIGCQIVYRGETRRSWPKAGFEYLNIEDFLLED